MNTWIRVITGIPTEADFKGTQGRGTPLVVDRTTGNAYIWVGTVLQIGGSGGGGGGVTDHGDLDGLADDDHTQYLTAGRGSLLFSPTTHAHAEATSLVPGFMPTAAVNKLAAIEANATRVLSGTVLATVAQRAYYHSESFVVPGLTPLDTLAVSVAAHTDNEENTAEMLDIEGIHAVPDTDLLLLTLTFTEPASGPIRFTYFAG